MSEEQNQTVTSAGADQNEPDDSEPTPKLQAELRAAYEKNTNEGKPPYSGVVIRTRGELQWIMRERGWRALLADSAAYVATSRIEFEVPNTRVNLSKAILRKIDLTGIKLGGADLSSAVLSQARLADASLMGADLAGVRASGVDLHGADLHGANLQGAMLVNSNLHDAVLTQANLAGARLSFARLDGANLRLAHFDSTTLLVGNVFGPNTVLADIVWDDVPLSLVDWTDLPIRGTKLPKVAGPWEHDWNHSLVARAYRQTATVLRTQGILDEANRFAYRAQVLQRQVLWRQAFLRKKGNQRRPTKRLRPFASYLGSGLLDLISGYGYKPLRSLIAYFVIISAFAGAYLINAQFAAPHLTWDEAFVLSISAFHGRGFFTSGISLGDTLARLAAGEAIIGLLIEITFIATFTQRFFSR